MVPSSGKRRIISLLRELPFFYDASPGGGKRFLIKPSEIKGVVRAVGRVNSGKRHYSFSPFLSFFFSLSFFFFLGKEVTFLRAAPLVPPFSGHSSRNH